MLNVMGQSLGSQDVSLLRGGNAVTVGVQVCACVSMDMCFQCVCMHVLVS